MKRINTRLQTPRGSMRKVGFYGCSLGGGAVVRISRMPDEDCPQSLKIDCPVCGFTHTVKPFWRKYMPRVDDGKEMLTL